MKGRFCILLMMLVCFNASAQFYSSGDDPGGIRWRSISSDNYRIIYPAGSDSLALRFGIELERWRLPLGSSIGYAPNGMYRRPMPVILHGFTAQANGSVTWAPRRMDLFTCPDASSPEPLDWITELAVHESRHVSQMQFARGRGFGLFNAVVGELFTGAAAALYPGPALLEGDAVVAETALTRAGRGRSADFLEHYRVSFAEGDFRDWYRWRWRSQKTFVPDHYRAGYMLVAGMRYVYDDPLFSARYYENVLSPVLPLPFFNLQKTVKQASGKNLKETWQEIAAAQQALWAADEAARGPFGTVRTLTPPARRYTSFQSPEAAGNDIFAIQQGLTFTPRLVRILPDGSTDSVRPFPSGTEQIHYSEATGRLFWSETVTDPRWTLKSESRVFYLGPDGRSARMLTREGNLFNPSPAPDGPSVSVTEYPLHGGSAVRVIDGRDGSTLRRYPAPDGLQVVETAWADGRLIASAISDYGFGLYDVTDGFHVLLPPEPIKIKQLRSHGSEILFVSDLNGVNELYRFNINEGTARLTNHRFGASDFLPDASGDSLTFAALTPAGRLLFREAVSGPVATGRPAPRPVADRLSEQEAALGAAPAASPARFSPAKPYRKLPHLLHLHSWAPMYVDYDAVANSSFETIASSAGLGATAFLQNDLGTASAIVGYSASRTKTDEGPQWFHSFHGRFTYRGLYPVIELGVDAGTRYARQYRYNTLIQTASRISTLEGKPTGTPYYRTTARMYVPLDFSRSGWFRGIVPRIDVQFANDMVNTTDVFQKLVRVIGDKPGAYRVIAGADAGRNVPLSRVTASLRGYTMLGTARSAIYPRWGIGAEAGLSARPGLTAVFAPSAFAYLYGYLPGVVDTHGIRLSVMHQARLDGRFPDNYLTMIPRGMTSVSELSSYIQSRFGRQTRLSADYAMPLLPLDWSGLGPVAFVRNFELTLHADGVILSDGGVVPTASGTAYTVRLPEGDGASTASRTEWLFSAGADISVRLGNLLWIPYDTRIGISYNYNGGTILDEIKGRDISVPAHHLGLIFSVNLP
ncbi:MAG: hypothetical protein IKH60_01860 [Bacteroidales bacterium]|nr:hypothetical protein [Bacteroidales bacterium]